MIELNFYRDDEYVYYNNPNGITKKMTIAEFEAIMSGESELPEYSSSNQGEVLSVDSDGDLEWASLPPSDIPTYESTDSGKVLTVNSGGTGLEWGESGGGVMLVNLNSTETGMSLNKTWQEIKTAADANKIVVIKLTGDAGTNFAYVTIVTSSASGYAVSAISSQGSNPVILRFTSATADGQLILDTGGGD